MNTQKSNDFGGRYLVQDQNHLGETVPVTVKAVHGTSRQVVRPSIRHQTKHQRAGSRRALAATA